MNFERETLFQHEGNKERRERGAASDLKHTLAGARGGDAMVLLSPCTAANAAALTKLDDGA